MPNWDYDEGCNAAPGVMGHMSCSCSSCNQNREDSRYRERRRDEIEQESVRVSRESKYTTSYEPVEYYSLPRDPLYFHTKMSYKEIVFETGKAYFIRTQKKSKKLAFWVPKTLLRKLDTAAKTFYIYKTFEIKQIDIVEQE